MKQYQRFILALVFVGTLFSSFHYHADIHESENCQVCILQNNIVGADLSSLPNLQSLELYFERPTYLISLCADTVNKDFNSRAPPSFS